MGAANTSWIHEQREFMVNLNVTHTHTHTHTLWLKRDGVGIIPMNANVAGKQCFF